MIKLNLIELSYETNYKQPIVIRTKNSFTIHSLKVRFPSNFSSTLSTHMSHNHEEYKEENDRFILEVGVAEGRRMIDATFKRPCHASNGIIQFSRVAIEFQTAASRK